MNYIELIKGFWQCNNERPIGPNATALYFYLIEKCNSFGWKESFKHSDRYIAFQLGISVNTVRTAKNKLKQLGLIDFKSPEKASKGLDGATSYRITTVSKFNTVPDTVVDTVPDTVVDTVPDTRNKLNKTKLITISLNSGDEKFICESLFKTMDNLINDLVWLEPVCMNNHLKPDEMKDYLKLFFSELQGREDCHKTDREAKDHFSKWLSVQLIQKAKEGGKNARSTTVQRKSKASPKYGSV